MSNGTNTVLAITQPLMVPMVNDHKSISGEHMLTACTSSVVNANVTHSANMSGLSGLDILPPSSNNVPSLLPLPSEVGGPIFQQFCQPATATTTVGETQNLLPQAASIGHSQSTAATMTRNELSQVSGTATTQPKSVIISTPEASEVPVSGAVQTSSSTTTPVVVVKNWEKPKPYNGSSSYRLYKDHFSRVSRLNNWTKAEQVQHLSLALEGAASHILRDISEEADDALDQIWAALARRFGHADESQRAMRQFDSRKQQDGESIVEFKLALRSLHREAWPNANLSDKDSCLKRRFEEGLSSADLVQFLRLHARNDDFSQTVAKARQFVDAQESVKPKKAVRIVTAPELDPGGDTIPQTNLQPLLDGFQRVIDCALNDKMTSRVDRVSATPSETTDGKRSRSSGRQQQNTGRQGLLLTQRSRSPGRSEGQGQTTGNLGYRVRFQTERPSSRSSSLDYQSSFAPSSRESSPGFQSSSYRSNRDGSSRYGRRDGSRDGLSSTDFQSMRSKGSRDCRQSSSSSHPTRTIGSTQQLPHGSPGNSWSGRTPARDALSNQRRGQINDGQYRPSRHCKWNDCHSDTSNDRRDNGSSEYRREWTRTPSVQGSDGPPPNQRPQQRWSDSRQQPPSSFRRDLPFSRPRCYVCGQIGCHSRLHSRRESETQTNRHSTTNNGVHVNNSEPPTENSHRGSGMGAPITPTSRHPNSN